MITNAQKPAENTPGLRKSAMLMVLLGEQTSAEILRELTEAEVQQISREIARIRRISSDQAEAVLDEYYRMTIAKEYALQGGLDYAKKVLVEAFGQEAAGKLLDRLVKSMGDQPANFDVLQKAEPQQLAKFIHNEHPQTIALVLSHLAASQAAALLSSLPAALRSDVAMRMASLDQISPEVIQRIASVIGQKLKNLGQYSRESYGGVRAVAEICNRLDAASSKEILDDMDQKDNNLAEMIRHLMFVFEDMLAIDSAGIRELIARVDRKVLTLALKGTSDQMRNHFLAQMSQRAQEMLREDMDAIGPVKIKNVEAAQQQIIAAARELEQQGVISLRGAAGEQYVM